MSTPAHNNDELFRQGLEDYREMPSLKVWEGVEAALDQEKKKRRFLFWLWFAGGGTSLAAILALVPVLLSRPTQEHGTASRAQWHIAPTRQVDLVIAQNHVGKPLKTSTTQTGNLTTSTVATGQVWGTSVTPRTPNPHAAHGQVAQTSGLSPASRQNTTQGQVSESRSTPSGTQKSTSENQTALWQSVTHGTHEPQNGTNTNTVMMPETGIRTRQHGIALALQDVEPVMTDRKPMPLLSASVLPAMLRVAPHLQATLTAQGYAGGVAYSRSTQTQKPSDTPPAALNTVDAADSNTQRKKFGLYAGATLKAGLVINRHWYVNVGIGYETHYFADRYRFQIPGKDIELGNTDTAGNLIPPLPTGNNSYNLNANTAFGDALIPFEVNTGSLTSSPQPDVDLNGKLVYQLQQLIIPIDVGYRYSYKRIGVYVGATAAFHVPLSQKAVFYADSGPVRTVQVNPLAPFNVSVGLEPGLEYNFSKRFSLLAGGTFRYQLLNAYKSGVPSRPYVLAGHVGLRVSL